MPPNYFFYLCVMIDKIQKIHKGDDKSYHFGSGFKSLSLSIGGLQSNRIYGIVAPPKTGKTTFVDNAFVINPIENDNKKKLVYIYFSYEIDKFSKQVDFVVHYLYKKLKITHYELPNNCRYKGNKVVEISPNLIKGNLLDDNYNKIRLDDKMLSLIRQVYYDYVSPIFKRILFVEDRNNPTGVRNMLLHIANKLGKIEKKKLNFNFNSKVYKKYKDYDVVVVMDHLRKLIPERGFNRKEVIDKMIEYFVELRNLLGWTFVVVQHTNRNLSSLDRIKFFDDEIYPTSDDIKDSGNLAEECDYLLSMFNPNDDKYQLKQHFGIDIRDIRGNVIDKSIRTIHLIESRHSEFPKHFVTRMLGNYKIFEEYRLS